MSLYRKNVLQQRHGTYLWILSNEKGQRRKGKIQLIDPTFFKAPLRKNLGEKNCSVTPEIRKKIPNLFLSYDKAAGTDKEQIPFSYECGIDAFIENEVRPYAPNAFIKPETEKIYYEIYFTKYSYQSIKFRSMEEITADIRVVENETYGLLDEIIGGQK